LAELEVSTRKEVTLFFSVLDRIVHKNNVDARQLFNMDETAFSTVQKPQKSVGLLVNTKLGQ
jgi:hypothetical protein